MNIKSKFLVAAVIVAINVLLVGWSSAQTFSNLYTFTGGADGGTVYASLTEGSDGNFYGTTEYGGLQDGGTVFRISPDGKLTNLFSFNNGEYFASGLVLGNDGRFYGTAGLIAGTPGGSIFKIDTNGTFTPLHSFTGSTPNGKLTLGRDGFFYGTTQTDTTHGTIFKISATGALTTLRSFSDSAGGSLNGGLVQGADGNFYGTTYSGGSNQVGSIFKISTAGSFAIVYSFKFNEGYSPEAGLILGGDGNFYGTTSSGGFGDTRFGTVFKFSTNGVVTYLHTFNRDAGWQLLASLLQRNNGDFYGTTSIGESNTYGNATGGTIFKISSNGKFTTLYRFSGGDDGSYSSAGLIQDGNGKFYGTTEYGGSLGAGTIFVLTLPSPPLLTISTAEPGVTLSWPTNLDDYPFTLQSTPALDSPAIWTSVVPDPVLVIGQNVVTNIISDTQQFYRLSQ